MEGKESNPKDILGSKKVPMHFVPIPVLMELGLAMMEGAAKYGAHNYRTVGVRASVYYSATWRHLGAWWEGEDLDPDSGVSHITKAIAGLTVLRDSMIRGNWVDDRPPKCEPFMAEYNRQAGALIDKYPNPKPAHLEKKTESHGTEKPALGPPVGKRWVKWEQVKDGACALALKNGLYEVKE